MTSRPTVGAPYTPSEVSTFDRPGIHRRNSSHSHLSSTIAVAGSDGLLERSDASTVQIQSDQVQRPVHTVSQIDLDIKDAADTSANQPLLKNGTSVIEQGRPPLFFWNLSEESTDIDRKDLVQRTEEQKSSQDQLSRTPLPFPPRPRSSALPTTLNTRGNLANTVRKTQSEQLLKPYTMNTSSNVPNFPDQGTADCFPWLGMHAEDQLTEQVVKNGYSIKAQVLNETNTARPSLWPHFKNKSGLHTLSSLFTCVLKQRQENGRVTAAPTFKPPPRVTLTDTKREAWLRDLANSAVPLRRLSRTIPHGIRGKILLEQCLTKHVPPARAVWLAKCVGANEVRAFRRKGVSAAVAASNEFNWIRDWTGFVEEFIEGVIDSCDQNGWKANMNYAVQLTTHIFAERLLDRDHFLEWLLDFFENCAIDKVPAAVLLLRLYWKDLTSNGKRGWRLTNTMLDRLYKISIHECSDLFLPITKQLQRLMQTCITKCPNCAIVPKNWSDHRAIFLALSEDADLETKLASLQVVGRIDRLNGFELKSSWNTISSRPQEILVALLDSIGTPANIQDISNSCLSNVANFGDLIAIILQWASSLYRSGSYRAYIAASLIQNWNDQGLDTDSAILNAFEVLRNRHGIDAECISRIIINLVKSSHFSVGRYMQWLIATGSLASCDPHRLHESCHTRPLLDMPLGGLSSPTINLRRTLLRSTGVAVYEEAQKIADLKSMIMMEMPDLFPQKHSSPNRRLSDTSGTLFSRVLSNLNWSITSEVGGWVHETCVHRAKGATYSDGEKAESGISLSHFEFVRKILETLEEIPTLARICQLVARSSDIEVLACVSDTLNFHLRTFDALGIASALFFVLIERYRTLRFKRPPQRDVVKGFVDTGTKLSVDPSLIGQLQREIALCEQGASVAACSPVSEAIFEDSLEPGADPFEEIERVLASGNTMEHDEFFKLFEFITSHLRRSEDSSGGKTMSLVSSLVKLKAFDEETFDSLSQGWIRSIIAQDHDTTLEDTIPALVGSSCVLLPYVVQCICSLLDDMQKQQPTAIESIALKTLKLLTISEPSPYVRNTKEYYRFKIERARFQATEPTKVVHLMQRVLEQSPQDFDIFALPDIREVLFSETMLSMLRQTLLVDPAALCPDIGQQHADDGLASSKRSRALLNALLDPHDGLGVARMSPKDLVAVTFEALDEFSFPICEVMLQYLLGKPAQVDDKAKSASMLLLEAIQNSISRGCQLWPRIIAKLDVSIVDPVRQVAEERILAGAQQPEGSTLPPQDELATCLSIVDAAASSIPELGASHVATTLLDLLKTFIHSPDNANTTSPHSPPLSPALPTYLSALLHLTRLHRPSFKHGKSNTSDTAAILITLANIMVSDSSIQEPVISNSTRLEIFDTIAFLIEDLPPLSVTAPSATNTHAQLLRDIAPLAHDPRIRFLFGFDEPDDAWFCLAHKSSSSSSASSLQHGNSTSAPSSGGGVEAGAGPKYVPFLVRPWELLPEAAPNAGENDTALSLRLFDARKVA